VYFFSLNSFEKFITSRFLIEVFLKVYLFIFHFYFKTTINLLNNFVGFGSHKMDKK